jgi:hypothetical protein
MRRLGYHYTQQLEELTEGEDLERQAATMSQAVVERSPNIQMRQDLANGMEPKGRIATETSSTGAISERAFLFIRRDNRSDHSVIHGVRQEDGLKSLS